MNGEQTNGTTRRRVAIVGGGMAGLSTAVQLAAAGGHDITLYQMGWRLGGKCASARNVNASLGHRIEEHGLHVWFGCYHNAFAMLRQCYASLGRSADIEPLFFGCTDTPYMEQVGNEWKVWPVHFPVLPGVPGDGPPMTTPLQYLEQAHRVADAWLRQLILHGSLEMLADVVRLAVAMRAVVESSGTASTSDAVDAIDRIRTAMVTPAADASDDLRRLWILANIGLATMRGVLSSLPEILRDGLEALDGQDFRAFLSAHGAPLTVAESTPIRALYDLCFAYRDGIVDWEHANFAAGTALGTVLRIALDYRGYVVYLMQAGMGDIVVAPIYEYLKQQGVQVRFFHRLEEVELTGDDSAIARLHLTRQADLALGIPEYTPLVPSATQAPHLPPVSCWPSEPQWSQLLHGAELQARGVNFESAWSPPGDDVPVTLDAGTDFDIAVVAVSLESVKRTCGALKALPKWATMMGALETVQTVGTQLWMTQPLDALGWTLPAWPIDAGPEPLDVWADRSPLLAWEAWPAPAPVGLHYLCGPLPGSYLDRTDPSVPADALAQARALTTQWLSTQSYGLWPAANSGGSFDWTFLRDPSDASGPARLDAQFVRANIDPSERYVLSIAGTTSARIAPGDTGIANLVIAGDWTRMAWNAGCVEAAVTSGLDAAAAVRAMQSASVAAPV